MNVVDADRVLAQWARWSSGELRRLGAESASWQRLVESGYAEEEPASALPKGAEADMLRADAALGAVRRNNPANFRMIAYVYRHDAAEDVSRWKLDAAIRAFISEWEGVDMSKCGNYLSR